MGRPHAAPAAAGNGLDHDRVADAFGHGQGVLLVFHRAFRTRRGLDAGFFGEGAAGRLVFQRVHGAGTGANKPDVAVLANIGEMRVLRQEAVTGMDRIHVGYFRRADDAVNPQVTVAARPRADADGFIGHLHVHGINVHFGINRHRADVHFLAGANDADRNFPAVGNENFFKHGWERARPAPWARSDGFGTAAGQTRPAWRFRPECG